MNAQMCLLDAPEMADPCGRLALMALPRDDRREQFRVTFGGLADGDETTVGGVRIRRVGRGLQTLNDDGTVHASHVQPAAAAQQLDGWVCTALEARVRLAEEWLRDRERWATRTDMQGHVASSDEASTPGR